jgi:hypothetical protein
MKTDSEIRIQGLRVLTEALGAVEAERFVTLLLREPFDYTAWRQNMWPDKTIDELSTEAMSRRKDTAV